MSVSTGNKINQMLQLGQKNGLLFAQWLTGRGYSSQLLKRYRISGWLTPLCRGVMYRTGITYLPMVHCSRLMNS